MMELIYNLRMIKNKLNRGKNINIITRFIQN